MKDSIINGTGNSRYLKSVENFKALYPTYDDFAAALSAGTLPVDLNGINPAGFQTIGTPQNMATFLKNDTAALYGLTSEAVPDDVLALLGPYTQYWWKKRTNGYFYEPVLKSTTIAVDTNATIQYSENISFSESGEPSLAEPISTLTLTYTGSGKDHEELYVLRGKYFLSRNADAKIVLYYAAPDAAATAHSGSYHMFVANLVTSKLANALGIWEYLRSNDRNAYPDKGIVDDVEYMFLGNPLENAVDVPMIKTGSYVGTGTFGSENPNSLTFERIPTLIVINGGTLLFPQHEMGWGLSTSSLYRLQTSVSDDFLTVSWYSASGASYQANTEGTTYQYMALLA